MVKAENTVKKFLKKIYFPCSISAPSLVFMAKDKTAARKGTHERTVYYEKDDFSYARTGLHQLDGRIRDGGE